MYETRTCRQCGKEFTPWIKTKTFCCKRCRNKYHYTKANEGIEKQKLSTTKSGTIGELKVVLDLLKMNKSVFFRYSNSCDCDIMYLSGNNKYSIEVKSGYIKKSGDITYSKSGIKPVADIVAVYLHNTDNILYKRNNNRYRKHKGVSGLKIEIEDVQ